MTARGKFNLTSLVIPTPFLCGSNVTWSLQSHTPYTHLYAQTAGLPLLVNSTLSAGPTEHIGTHFALALQLLKESKHIVGTLEILLVSTEFTHRAALFPYQQDLHNPVKVLTTF